MKPLKTSNFTNFSRKINSEIINHRNAYLLKNYMATGISFSEFYFNYSIWFYSSFFLL